MGTLVSAKEGRKLGMVKRIPLVGALVLSLGTLFPAPVQALPFSVMDGYSFAMGGTGTASGTRGNAVFYNPALLAASDMPKDYSLQVPVLGARFYDKEKVNKELDKYQYLGLESTFDSAMNVYTGGDASASAIQAVGDAAISLRQQLLNLGSKPMQREFFGAVVVGIPNDTIGMSLVLDARVLGGARVSVTQHDLDELQRILDAATNATIDTGEAFRSSDLTSRLLGRGLAIREVALAMAQKVKIYNHEIAIGVTPKYRQVTSFDYSTALKNADFETNLGQKDHTAFDVDLGAAKHYGNGWSTGVTIKNLIGQEYQTARGNIIRIKTQARLATAHKTKYTLVAMDVDLNESPSTGFDAATQYLSLGGKLNVFDMTRIRIGYRHNMKDSDTSVATFGLGFTAYGAQMDVAVGASQDEIDYSAQMGFEF